MTWEMNGTQRVEEGSIYRNFEAEERVAQAVAAITGNGLLEFPRFAAVDRLLMMNGLAMGWLEVKTRNTPRNHYPTYRLATDKLRVLRSLEYDTQIPAIIAVEWACGSIGVVKASHPAWSYGNGYEDIPVTAFFPIRTAN